MNIDSPKRVYRQSARASAAEATGERIVEAFFAAMQERWFDEIKLDEIAREAGVTAQTVIRRFGSKEGLLDALRQQMDVKVGARRDVPEGDVHGVVAALLSDYEEHGRIMMRMLEQENRFAACRAVTDHGKAMHRMWITKAFRPWLAPMAAAARQKAEDSLVVAGDLYVWKLVRGDMQRSLGEYRDIMETMLAAAIGVARETLFGENRAGAGT